MNGGEVTIRSMDYSKSTIESTTDSESTAVSAPEDEVTLLRVRIRELQQDNERLAASVQELQQRVAVAQPAPVEDFYSIHQFTLALALKRGGRTYAWRTDYATATQESPRCQKVTMEDIQRWQKDQKVPAWAFAQIEWMTFKPRTSQHQPDWSEDNIQHLVCLVRANPEEKNAVLAKKCTEHFGRHITEDSIKGEKFRLQHSGRLP